MLKPLLLSSLALALAACGGQAEKTAIPKTDANGDLRYGDLVFKPCALGGDHGNGVEAQCATLMAPENHDAPNGRKISLAVAIPSLISHSASRQTASSRRSARVGGVSVMAGWGRRPSYGQWVETFR